MMKRGVNRKLKRASATVEMAIVTPILLTLVFGIIEYGWVFTVRQAMTNAAREGARVAILRGTTDTDIQTRASEYLAPYGMVTAQVGIEHAVPGNPIETVTITSPYADVTLIGAFFGSTAFDLTAVSSMRKEGE